MFGNVGALAIAVVSTLCTSEPLRSQVGPACETRAVSYIAWYLIAQNVIMFSWGEALLFAEPTEEPAAIVAAAPSRASSLGSDVKGVGSAGALAEPSVFCVERATTEEGAGSPEAAGGGALNPPPYLHSASSRAPLSPSRSLVSPSSTAGLGGLGAAVDASCSADSLGMGSAASVNTAPRMRRQRFRTAAVRARPGDDNVLIRRSSSFAYNQRSEQRRLSRSTSSLAGAGMAALLDPQQRDDEDGGTEAGYGRELGDDEMAALVPTLSYAEIQQAASRVGLEVLAFHPMHHASTSLLASTAALEPAFGSGANAEPLLQKEANQFAVIVRPGAALHGLLTVTAMRAYSVAAGVLKNPPIQAALLAVALSAYPPVKACLVGPAAPLRFASSAVESLGAAQVPISMLMLSGSGTINYMKKLKNRLEAAGADLPPFSFSVRAELAMIVGRLVVLPIAGYALYALLGPSYLGLLPTDDPLLLLVILIESAVPSGERAAGDARVLCHGLGSRAGEPRCHIGGHPYRPRARPPSSCALPATCALLCPRCAQPRT